MPAEAVTAPEVGPRCAITGGTWFSYYDEATVSLDIDHTVPLAEARDSDAPWSPSPAHTRVGPVRTTGPYQWPSRHRSLQGRPRHRRTAAGPSGHDHLRGNLKRF
ncbi:hypothetical protein ScoT_63150 [Streptomyces albidoflavus]|uniref:HNH endonuclease n=1 Tax=Streptomyces albidoflavus TaxID=1886 RepID=A0AA37C481_9ACTN|nr:hypothetical protein ScoT_63150 [Streptomyces albidoflavus]